MRNLRPENAQYVLFGLYLNNLAELQQLAAANGGRVPSVLEGIQRGEIVYDKEDPDEDWKTYATVLREKRGDCEELATAVAAELTFAGEPAIPWAYPSGPGLWHVVVDTLRWGLLDPSVAGGMESSIGAVPFMAKSLLEVLASRMRSQ